MTGFIKNTLLVAMFLTCLPLHLACADDNTLEIDPTKYDLFMPPDVEQGQRFPAIVIIHGGGWKFGDKSDGREQSFGKELSQNGYVCISINYTLAESGKPSWPQNLYECKQAVQFLRKNAEKYHVDPDNIAVLGGSAGGHLAAMVALTNDKPGFEPDGPFKAVSTKNQAVVAMYGVHDLLTFNLPTMPTLVEDLLGATKEQNSQLWRSASPISHTKANAPPFLIIHGTKDDVVSVEQSIELHESLKKKGVETKLLLVEGAGHSFDFHPPQQNLLPTVLEFLNKHLKQKNTNKAKIISVRDLSVEYISSEDPNLVLYAAFIKTGTKPKPILAYLHGWHGNRYYVARDLEKNQFMLDRFFLIGIDMRGRASTGKKDWWGTPDPQLKGKDGLVSGGEPDASGWGLNDIVDAIETAKRRYSEHTLDDPVYVIGHSGGGGNTMAIIGKFPDYFSAAYAGSGMCDYARWAVVNSYWRPSIEKWVGAKLGEDRQAFNSHSGLTTVANRITPIALSHGDKDDSVAFELSQTYVKANAELKKPVPFKIVKGGKHGVWGHYKEIVEFLNQYTAPPLLAKKGKLVVTGYIKTRKFQVILPSIHSITKCMYDLSNGLTLNLNGGKSGTMKIRIPKDVNVTSAQCTSAGKDVKMSHSCWHDWHEYGFEYTDSATITLKALKK